MCTFDMVLVYVYQTLMRMTKLKAKYTMDLSNSAKLVGAFPIKVSAPMERANPKTKSESVSMRDFGVDLSFSSAICVNFTASQFIRSAI